MLYNAFYGANDFAAESEHPVCLIVDCVRCIRPIFIIQIALCSILLTEKMSVWIRSLRQPVRNPQNWSKCQSSLLLIVWCRCIPWKRGNPLFTHSSTLHGLILSSVGAGMCNRHAVHNRRSVAPNHHQWYYRLQQVYISKKTYYHSHKIYSHKSSNKNCHQLTISSLKLV